MNFYFSRFQIAFLLILSAILSVLSQPVVIQGLRFPSLGFLAWFSYVPLLLALSGQPGKKQLQYGLIFGLLFYFGLLFWLYTAMHTFGNLSPLLSAFGLILTVFCLSLLFALIFWVSAFLEKNLKISRFWILPLVWVSIEWIRNYFPFQGFPWGQAGYSQSRYLQVIQIADITGVYGVTGLLALVNAALAEWIQKRAYRSLKLVGAFAMLVVALGYGWVVQGKIQEEMHKSPKVKVALLQGNIPQSDEWLLERTKEIIEIYQSLTRKALEARPAFIIWPEVAYPLSLPFDAQEPFEDLKDSPVPMVVGTLSYELAKLPPNLEKLPPDLPTYNSIFLIQPGGRLSGAYHKRHLVPFGEYIPLKPLLKLFGMEKLVPQGGDILAGEGFPLLEFGKVRLGGLVCYDGVFPELARQLTKQGANLLVILTNDAWYGDSSALPQHLNFAIFRAVENRRTVLRSTNNGITVTINPLGRVQKQIPPFKTRILTDEVLLFSGISFYARFGDLFCWISAGITLIIAGIALFKRFLSK